MNDKEDSPTREGPAAVDGEKPLKGGTQGRSGLKHGREGSEIGGARERDAGQAASGGGNPGEREHERGEVKTSKIE